MKRFGAILSVVAVAGVAWAGAATDAAKGKVTALLELVRAAKPDDKKIGATIDDFMDLDKMAVESLGAEWNARSAAEKNEYTPLVKQLLRKSLEKNMKKIASFNLDFVGEGADGSRVVVKTKAKSKTDAREEPVEINYSMEQKDGKWRAVDIQTEGVSLVSSYRSQFTKIVKKDGFPALIQKMKDKIAKGDV